MDIQITLFLMGINKKNYVISLIMLLTSSINLQNVIAI
jgi:hypothetical protein